MGRTTGPEQTTMTLQVEVELSRVSDLSVDNGPSGTITRPISIPFALWEKPDVMAL
jgi:hypothetical protein